MTISDSLPINFWLTSQNTFNQEDICVVHKDCFCQFVAYGEEITLQFQHQGQLILNVYNTKTNDFLTSTVMQAVGSTGHQSTFIPNQLIGSDTIKNIYFTVEDTESPANVLAKSDCVIIGGTVNLGSYTKNYDLACQVGITYTNAENFDNLIYEQSPQPEFKIVIEGNFWKEENPKEQEDIELSNGEIVTLRGTIQQKRLLETGYMPNYMHLKLQKILMHDTIVIDGIEYKQRDPYEKEQPDRYGLSKATVLLTKYDSVQRNTI